MGSTGTYLDREYICPLCNKKFYVPYTPQWSYKIRTSNGFKVYCSWSCLSKAKDKKQSERRYKSLYYD